MAVSDYSGLISSAERANGLPPGMMNAVVTTESGGDPNAVSGAGAIGAAQLMPGTAQDLGVTDPTDPKQAIPAGARYLRQQYDRFGDWGHALAAYNAGPARVARSLQQTGDIPDVAQPYVSKIVDHMAASGIPPGGMVQPADAPAEDDPGLSPAEMQAAVQGGTYTTDPAAAARLPDLASRSDVPPPPDGADPGSIPVEVPINKGVSGAPPAPAPPIPGGMQDPRDPNVWRKPDGSIGYINTGSPSAAAGAGAIEISGSSSPAFIQSYLAKHPDMIGPQPSAAPDGQLSSADMQAALAGGYSLDPGGPIVPGSATGAGGTYGTAPGGAGAPAGSPMDVMGGGDPDARPNPLLALLRPVDTAVRGLANGATFGLADKAAALDEAFPALLKGGLSAFQPAYSAAMDRQQQRDRVDARDLPAVSFASRMAGGVVPAAFLPEVTAPSMLGRAAIGAGQGALLGGLDSGLSARGSAGDMVQASVPGMIWGGALGAPLGAAFGARVAGEAPAHLADLKDYAAAGVDPMLAVNGGRSLQQIGQVLKGTPIVGGPLAEAASRTQNQVHAALENIAGRFGTAGNLEEAGAPIMAANRGSADAVQAGQRASSDALQGLAAKYGGGAGRRASGEAVQDAVTNFARGGDTPMPGAASLPVRATSFADKSNALYDDAFGRLDNEMKGGVRATAEPVASPASPFPPADGATAGGGGPATSNTVRDQALNIIRKGRTVRPNTGPSLMDFVAQNGGLHDQGGEVSAMDGDLWHRDLSHTGAVAFRRKIIRPGGLGLEDMAQKAADAGYFPDAQVPSWNSSDNMHAVGGQDLVDAMRGELAGNKRYADFDPTAANLFGHVQDAQEMIDHLGLDPKTQSNAEMKAAMDDFLSGRSSATGKPAPPPAPEMANAEGIRPTATKAVLDDILSRAQSPAVKGLLDAPQVKTIADAVGEPGKLSFQDLRGLRTWVRQAQRNTELRQTVGSADLQRLEGSLSSDIYDNASRLASPAAAKQLRRADQFYGAGMQRINGALKAYFKAPSGEKAFDGIVSAAQIGGQADIRRLTGLQRSLAPQDWSSVASSVLGHLGDTPQGFDLDTFVRNYGKLSPEGSDVLFGGRNAALQQSLGDVVAKARSAVSAEPTTHFGDTPASAMEGLLRASMQRGSSADIGAVKTLRSAIPDQQWGDVAAGVLRTLGRKGDAFSPDQFSTAWAKLSPEARQTIFGGPGHDSDPASIESLVKVMQQQKAAGKFYNHSQSGHAAVGVLLMEHLGAFLSGEVPMREAAHMAATAGIGYGASKLLASPGAARLLLRGVRANTSAEADRIGSQMGSYSLRNPNAADAMEGLRKVWMRQLRVNSPVAAGASTVGQARRQFLPAPQ